MYGLAQVAYAINKTNISKPLSPATRVTTHWLKPPNILLQCTCTTGTLKQFPFFQCMYNLIHSHSFHLTTQILLIVMIDSVFFRAFRGGNFPPPPLSFEFLPQTITNFVCFLDILHIFSPHKSNFPPKTTSLEKTLVMNQDCTLHTDLLPQLFRVLHCRKLRGRQVLRSLGTRHKNVTGRTLVSSCMYPEML